MKVCVVFSHHSTGVFLDRAATVITDGSDQTHESSTHMLLQARGSISITLRHLVCAKRSR